MPPLTQPAYRITSQPRPLETLPLGASRFGGSPDLPAGFEWPQHRGRPITFLAQFDLSELQLPTLPPKGWLLFFYDVAEQPWGFDPLHRGSARVIYLDVERDALLRATHPDVTSAGGPYEPCALAFQPERESSSESGDTAPHHHLLGCPQLLQGDLWGQCQLVTHGIYCGEPSGYESRGAAELLSTAAEEWQLLLQLDSDATGPDFCWEEDGRLYFCIRRADLAKLAFEQAWLILQTTLV